MASKFFGVIYITPLKMELSIVNLKELSVLERISSAPFIYQDDSEHKIYQEELQKIIATLGDFNITLKEYGVTNYAVWGNKQLIDDVSARYLTDQIYVRTGIKINWLNTNQITYYKAIAVMTLVNNFDKLSNHPTYLLNLGSATITLSKFEHQQFVTSWDIDLSYQDMEKMVASLRKTVISPVEVLSDYIGSKLETIRIALKATTTQVNLIIQGSRALNAKFLFKEDDCIELEKNKFSKIYSDALSAPDQYLFKYFIQDDNAIDRIIPDLLVINKIIQYTQANKLYLTNLAVSTGLALEEAFKGTQKNEVYTKLILTSAENIAQRYQISSYHHKVVSSLALHLFDQLKRLHRLNKRHRLLLQIASTVDDIGNFINQHGHYRHSAYILESNKIIGLSDIENQIIAEISRYHSAESPEVNQHHYRHLDADIQMPVAKLAAILRLADALDDSREQKITKISVSLQEEQVVITAISNQNLALEKWAFSHKLSLFKEVYGITPVLKQRRSTK
ncbi:exopolyphosphatase [Ligilactobacillus sp. WILCCON 0076]|uniref:Exopolyphosphatase n=1 Tax=Ligilactobacillus ubinensis TaxID=2876789 RepID=A0A9X2JP12_9LACO|nr:exopolyphosphatase [Ligilactobacillus ubinensis]MCP0887671.1 exopolyphosphatase [Ligilactobacillus ubinensis]